MSPELAARARRHFVEGAATIAEYERVAVSIPRRRDLVDQLEHEDPRALEIMLEGVSLARIHEVFGPGGTPQRSRC